MALRRREELWYGGRKREETGGGETNGRKKKEKPLSLSLSPFFKKHTTSHLGSYVTHETKHFIYFYLGHYAVLLFKSG